jgi:peptidyl-prolyl cis-trans isomerase SurA
VTHALLALSLAAAAAAPATPPLVLDRVAALLNGEVVTLHDLQDRAGEELRRAAAAPAGAEREQATRRALRRAWDQVVAERLFHAQALTLQLEIGEAQVEGAIDDIKKRNRFDDTQFDLALAGQGLDRAAFKAQFRRELESMQVLNYRVRSRVKVTDEDVQNYFRTHPAAFGGEEELHVRHLMLPLAADAAPAAVQAAQAQGARLLARAQAGEELAALVRELSKGASDGDLGWLKRGQIQKQLEDAFVGLADGQVSKLVRAGPGLHLFKVEGRRVAGGRTLEQAKDEIRDTLTQEQTASYREQYLAELKREAVIELRLPELKD